MGRHYSHLCLEERRRIARWHEAKMSVAEIADRLGRDASTIYRDIKRNRYTDTELPELNGYYGVSGWRSRSWRSPRRRSVLDEALADVGGAGQSGAQQSGHERAPAAPSRFGRSGDRPCARVA